MTLTLKITALFLLTATALPGQERAAPTLRSGPAVGADLTPIPAYATDGPRAGQEFDAAARIRESPGAFLFIHELTRNTAPMLRGLDALATEFSVLGFRAQSILLAGDRTEAEAQLKRVNRSLRLAEPIVLSTDGAEGPGNYALNRKAALTVVFTKDGKVTQSLALADTGPNDLPVLRAAIEELTGKIPVDDAALKKLLASRLPSDPEELKALATDQALELRRLRARLAAAQKQARKAGMQRQPARQPSRRGREATPGTPPRDEANPRPARKREGAPPEDPALLSSLRNYIRKTNDDARVDEVYNEIKARAGESKALTKEAVEMFKLMLSIDYGTAHAQKRAREFLKEADASKDE